MPHIGEGEHSTHRLVINGEVVVQLDDALGFGLELPVGLLSPPLFQVAVAVILAPWRDMNRYITEEEVGGV